MLRRASCYPLKTPAKCNVPSVPKRHYAAPPSRGSTLGAAASSPRSQFGLSYTKREHPAPLVVRKMGIDLINDPIYNKGTGYSFAERDRLGLRGLVPPKVFDIEHQVQRVLNRFYQCKTDLDKYVYLSELQDRNETIFYRVLMDNIEHMARIVYTPTVGEACIKFGHQYRRPRGMYISAEDSFQRQIPGFIHALRLLTDRKLFGLIRALRGEMSAMVYNWPSEDVDVIVVTDGSRILGLGDLGAHGMGIPIGKVALYVAAGGIHPRKVLPITLDVGTNNEQLLQDPLYLGYAKQRLRGDSYFSFIDEFMSAVTERWPGVLIQFEDFDNASALPILQQYREKYTCFNDDIQGTGAVALAGVLSALRVQGLPMSAIKEQRVVCLGAGSAGLGVCNAIIMSMMDAGFTYERACKQFYLVDKDGLLGTSRKTMASAQLPFARNDLADGTKLLETIEKVKPTILLGLSGVGGQFNETIVKTMTKYCDRPIIFPMSNPTANAECTAEQAFKWTNGRAIFASGSPFDKVELNGKTHYPSQGNNMYIFPGVGLAAVACRATKITDKMLQTAATALASMVSRDDLDKGKVYPDVTRIREVSERIAIEVAKHAISEGLGRMPEGRINLEAYISEMMYSPAYVPLVRPPPTGRL